MKRPTTFALLWLLVTVVAAGLRLPQLGIRPMHADEAVQAARFRTLWQHGRYTYDPNEFHGPTLMYATLPAAWSSGADSFAGTTEAMYRIVPALFGTGLVLLCCLYGPTLGKSAALWAALLAACSPAMVFYSRYYIHETLLAFFSLAAIGCGWRYVQQRTVVWCVLAGASVGLMQATKETAAIAYLAAGFATAALLLVRRPWRNRHSGTGTARLGWHLGIGLLVALLVGVLLYSSFGTNWRGPLDAILTYAPWLTRAGGESPHIHPWYFYLQRLVWWQPGTGPVWSETLILVLAAVGAAAACLFRRADRYSVLMAQWLAGYSLAITLIYSTIPYKTPWCMLQLLVGLIPLAGYGAASMVQAATLGMRYGTAQLADSWAAPAGRVAERTRLLPAIITVLLLGGVGQLAWQAYRASYREPAAATNPYNYVPTSPGALKLADQLTQLAQASPQQDATGIKVIWQDAYYWPLPWYLRRFEQVQWWTRLPSDPTAPIVLSSPGYDRQLTELLGEDYIMTGYFQLRPQVLVQLWVQFDLWEAHLKRLGRI